MREHASVMTINPAERSLQFGDYVSCLVGSSFGHSLRGVGLRSSASGLLTALLGVVWLVHAPATRQYSLGLRMWQVSEQYRGHRQLARLATPVMDRLRTELGDTTRLAQLDGTDNVLIGICESDQPTCVHSAVETWLPADETDFRRCYHASTVRTCPKRTEHAVGGVRSIGGTVLLNGAVISRTKRS